MSIFGLGPLPKETPEAPAAPALNSYGDLAARIQKQSEARQAYFDQLTEQLKARRYGPSASERLFAISAALAQPTRTPGFGGMLANVTPVFEQYAKDKRAAEAARASDMEKLGLARLNLGDDEIKTALELQQLQNQYKIAQMRANTPRPVVAGPQGALEPMTGQPVATPIPQVYTDLEANPTSENLEALAKAYPRFVGPLQDAYKRGVTRLTLTPSGGR
jgi:hypothetical protein